MWQVHGCIATLVGGVRALLLQAAHPAPLSGVAEHSRYESDPLGRLAGTTRWLTVTTFAATEVIEREAARVNAMHDHVKGEFTNKQGHDQSYKAKDPRFLLWVHCAFTDSFLKAHLALGYSIAGGPLTSDPFNPFDFKANRKLSVYLAASFKSKGVPMFAYSVPAKAFS